MSQWRGRLSGGRAAWGRSSCGGAVTEREDPPEDAERGSPAPAVLRASALCGAHTLHKSADDREQQVQSGKPCYQTLHRVASNGRSTCREPARSARPSLHCRPSRRQKETPDRPLYGRRVFDRHTRLPNECNAASLFGSGHGQPDPCATRRSAQRRVVRGVSASHGHAGFRSAWRPFDYVKQWAFTGTSNPVPLLCGAIGSHDFLRDSTTSGDLVAVSRCPRTDSAQISPSRTASTHAGARTTPAATT
jgi:hypothetical protein